MPTETRWPNDPAERAATGKAARADRPRSSHAELSAASRDPVAILAGQDENRVPELVPIRYGRMLASPFAFFRGAAAVMAADLAGTPASRLHRPALRRRPPLELRRLRRPRPPPRLRLQRLRRDLPGPVRVGREAAGRQRRHRRPPERGFGKRERRQASLATAAALPAGDARVRGDAQPRGLVLADRRRAGARSAALRRSTSGAFRRVERNLAKARAKDSIRALGKLTHEDGGRLRIVSEPPLITPIEELTGAEDAEHQLREVVDTYRESLSPDRRHLASSYRYVHAARKVVGVGSVGTRAWIVLLLGRDCAGPALPAGEGSRDVGPRALRRGERVRPPRPPRRRRAAADAGGERHLPRLGDRHRGGRRGALLLRAPDVGRQGLGRSRGALGAGAGRPTALSAAGRWPAPTPARATASRSPPTSAAGTPSTRRSPSSPRPTPIATKATSSRSARPPTTAGSPSRKASCEPGDDPAGAPRPPPRRRHPAAALRGAGRLRPRRRRHRPRRRGDDRPPQRLRLAAAGAADPAADGADARARGARPQRDPRHLRGRSAAGGRSRRRAARGS